MDFLVNNQKYILPEYTTSKAGLGSLHFMQWLVCQGLEAYLMKTVEAWEKGLEDELTHEQAVVLDYLLTDYQLVFHVPMSIPPPCSHDHCIN